MTRWVRLGGRFFLSRNVLKDSACICNFVRLGGRYAGSLAVFSEKSIGREISELSPHSTFASREVIDFGNLLTFREDMFCNLRDLRELGRESSGAPFPTVRISRAGVSSEKVCLNWNRSEMWRLVEGGREDVDLAVKIFVEGQRVDGLWDVIDWVIEFLSKVENLQT
eukprot:Phypoly_transcript_20808.p1 GENE.Phypoly_transcript_20808~~Phypoly_transcript_20808.p1  ORF type:complete len:167 (+),score=17.71 Phypoly_transcript_20808:103-603(+)